MSYASTAAVVCLPLAVFRDINRIPNTQNLIDRSTFSLNIVNFKMAIDRPEHFDLSTTAIGLPAFVVACLGAITTLIFLFKISRSPAVPDDKGDPERKKMALAITRLGKAIADGASAFIFKEYTYLSTVAALLFILVSVAVHWQTGLW